MSAFEKLCSSSRHVETYFNVTGQQFQIDIQSKREPALLKQVDIGQCTKKWTFDYLMKNVGNDEVKIHATTIPEMDFINKNFIYRSLPFDELIKRIYKETQTDFFLDPSEKYYLRSLGNNVRKDVANIKNQFPNLAADLHIPSFFKDEQFFSSVFRISSPGLRLWTHYDIMDNILIQITGTKRVVLFHPNDLDYLYLIGDKSSVLNIDDPDLEKYPNFLKATKYECLMEPGDILFIPALWFHNILALTPAVAVNAFWYHLDRSNYDKSDVYGNKDLPVAVQANQLVQKAIKCLNPLPEEYKEFYYRKLINSLQHEISKMTNCN